MIDVTLFPSKRLAVPNPCFKGSPQDAHDHRLAQFFKDEAQYLLVVGCEGTSKLPDKDLHKFCDGVADFQTMAERLKEGESWNKATQLA